MILSLEEQNDLIVNNLAMVTKIVTTKFKLGEDEFDDLFQEGCLGLIYAARHFNPDYGFAFSTYAYPTIIGYIKKYKRHKAMHLHGLCISRNISDDIAEISRYAYLNGLDLSDANDIKQIETMTGIKVPNTYVSSLQSIYQKDNNETFEIGDLIADSKNNLEDADFKLFVEDILNTLEEHLSTRDFMVISYSIHMYLQSGYALTQKIIAEHFNISQTVVSRILKNSKNILKRYKLL